MKSTGKKYIGIVISFMLMLSLVWPIEQHFCGDEPVKTSVEQQDCCCKSASVPADCCSNQLVTSIVVPAVEKATTFSFYQAVITKQTCVSFAGFQVIEEVKSGCELPFLLLTHKVPLYTLFQSLLVYG